MKKSDVVAAVLGQRLKHPAANKNANAFAPSNIALCKYWGKRNTELNLPMTSSLSISLGEKGAKTELALQENDQVILNGETIDLFSNFGKRLTAFLDLFRTPQQYHFCVTIQTNIPIAAGLASSACGFASLVMALDRLFAWELTAHELSILARLGSGSASRSIAKGFVEWHVGIRDDGMDSYGEVISDSWSELCIGLLILHRQEKTLSSRDAMQRTLTTSTLYSVWPEKVKKDLILLKDAIQIHDFVSLGQTAESNALTMHATMLSAWPPICYCLPETIAAMQKIWDLRKQGLPLYFTQDAGPNLKLLFLEKDRQLVQDHFLSMEVLRPFS